MIKRGVPKKWKLLNKSWHALTHYSRLNTLLALIKERILKILILKRSEMRTAGKPKYSVLRRWKKGQWHRKWTLSSDSKKHLRQRSVVESFALKRNALRGALLARMLVSLWRSDLLTDLSIDFDSMVLRDTIRGWNLFDDGVERKRAVLWFRAQCFIEILTWETGRGVWWLIVSRVEASFAKASALSLPVMPMCPLIQCKVITAFNPSSLRQVIVSMTIIDEG